MVQMKQPNKVLWMLALQLVINVCHISIHHFALNLLWTKSAGPSLFSKMLIYGGGLACMAFIAKGAGLLQKRQKEGEMDSPGAGTGTALMVFLLVASFVMEGLTLYLVQ